MVWLLLRSLDQSDGRKSLLSAKFPRESSPVFWEGNPAALGYTSPEACRGIALALYWLGVTRSVPDTRIRAVGV